MTLYNDDSDINYDYLDWMVEVVKASQKLVKCKGRYHAELNYKQLEEIVKKEPKDESNL